jgi:hypothetical protein
MWSFNAGQMSSLEVIITCDLHGVLTFLLQPDDAGEAHWLSGTRRALKLNRPMAMMPGCITASSPLLRGAQN